MLLLYKSEKYAEKVGKIMQLRVNCCQTLRYEILKTLCIMQTVVHNCIRFRHFLFGFTLDLLGGEGD